MARPQKNGLDYFPLDVDIDQDDKVALVEAKHGLEGFAIIIKLLMKIYKNSYFYEWTEKEQLLFSKRVNVDINQVNVVINDCIKWDFFNSSLLETHKVLTSRGIQKRYLAAIGRRQKVEIESKYLLLDKETVNVYKNLVIVDSNPSSKVVNVDINPQRKEEKSKVKERREENTENISSLSLSLCKEVETLTCAKWFLAKEVEALNALIEIYTYEWVRDAVLKVISKNKYSLAYADGILKNWASEGKEDIKVGSTRKDNAQSKGKYTGFKPAAPKVGKDIDTTDLI